MPKTAHLLGKWGEEFAAKYLRRNGYEILACNWRSAAAEIDLIAESASTIVFCEVKTRASDHFGHPTQAVDQQRISRIKSATELWPNPSSKSVRIDVISICLHPRIQLEHFEGVDL